MLNSSLFYIEQLLVAFPISEFISLVAVPIGITSSKVGIKNCAITARLKKKKGQLSRKTRRNMKK